VAPVEPVLPVGNKQVVATEGKLQQRADNEGRIDWEVRFVDATVVRAHQHVQGRQGTGILL